MRLTDAPQDLQGAGRLLRALFDADLHAMVLTDVRGELVEANEAACTLFGVAHEQLMGRQLATLIARTAAAAGQHGSECQALHADGSTRAVECCAVSDAVTDTNLMVLRERGADARSGPRRASALPSSEAAARLFDDPACAALAVDAEHERAALLLQESQRLLEQAQALAHVGSFSAGRDRSAPVHWSRECARIFGRPHEQPPTMDELAAMVHPEQRAQVTAAREQALATIGWHESEHRILAADGRVRWVQERMELVDASGFGVVQDLTDRRSVSGRLHASEERYRRIIESTSEGVWLVDANAITVFVNGQMAKMLGYGPEELVGLPLLSFMLGETLVMGEQRLAAHRRGVAESFEGAYRKRDGGTLWAFVKTNPLLDEQGRFEGALALFTDISERRRIDDARNRLASIVESSEDAIISSDLGGIIESWNRGAEQLYGYTAKESIGRSLAVLLPADRQGEERLLLGQIAEGRRVPPFETTRRRRDGMLVDVSVVISPIRDARDRVVGASKIARNLSEQRKTEAQLRRTEEQLRHAQKLEAIGSLAGGVAHDFNNLLSIIQSYIGLALKELPPDGPLWTDLQEVSKAAQRGADLTKQLLAFSRRQLLEPQVLDLNRCVRELMSMLQRVLGEHIELSLVEEQGLGSICADAGQLEQIIMNLVVNARDSMASGGRLVIETRSAELDAEVAAERPDVVPGPYVMLAVRDTGTGIERSIMPRIFEPFFTTKPQGEGSGLGLSTVYGIVKQSGGHVFVDSEPGQGTTFQVYFPRTRRSSQPQAAPAASGGRSLQGSETILLVEDDDAVRASIRTVLLRRGYQVLEAQSSREALLVWDGHKGSIDLLLTDVGLPQVNGRVLAGRLCALRPQLKVIYVSGHPETSAALAGSAAGGAQASAARTLQKPFTPDALATLVREVLDC